MAGFVQAVAVDLDGTITRGGALDLSVIAALDECRWAGAATILVTGRIEAELEAEFPDLLTHFDAAVLENGALLVVDKHRTVLASVDPLLAPRLRDRSIPLRGGVAILACRSSDATTVLDGIDSLGLDAQLVHNRNELMVVPSGVSKGTGLRAALSELGISVHNALAVGDAENDLAMLSTAEIAVAAAGSIDSVRRVADLVVPEGPDQLANFLRGPIVSGAQPVRSRRRDLRIGRSDDGSDVTIPGAQAGILVSGESGAGKSHLTGLLVERWIGAGYTVLVIDPEGDHSSLADLHQTVLVKADGTQSVDDLVQMLCQRSLSVVLDLSSMEPSVTVPYLATIASGIEVTRSQYGLPHWIVIDEAHGVLGEDGTLAHIFRPNDGGYCYVTYRPETLCTAAKTTIDVSLTALGQRREGGSPAGSRAVIRMPGSTDREFVPDPRVTSHVRHRNKYRDTPLLRQLRFHFRDSTGRVVSTAATVGELINGIRAVPDEAILHHALRGDFSRWALGAVQDRSLGSALAAVENDCSARVSSAVKAFRRHAASALEQRYGANGPEPR
jgi:phosphoserine phosphatase